MHSAEPLNRAHFRMTENRPGNAQPNRTVVCAQSEVAQAPLWWIALETNRAIIGPPVWHPGRYGNSELELALIDPRAMDIRRASHLPPEEQLTLKNSRHLIALVENGAPIVLPVPPLGSAYVAINPQFRIAADPKHAEIYTALRVRSQPQTDWELAAELSLGFDVASWARLPMPKLAGQTVFDLMSGY